MGGFGSGRYSYSSAATCEGAHSIDLAWLRRRGILELGNRTTLTWSWGGEKTGSIGVVIHADGLPIWDAFLDQATRGDAELVAFLRRVADDRPSQDSWPLRLQPLSTVMPSALAVLKFRTSGLYHLN